MASVIDRIGDKRISILDVGSGPVTSVGRRYVDFQIEISAYDPLADSYREMLDLHGIRPPVATEFALAEDLNFHRTILVNSPSCIAELPLTIRSIPYAGLFKCSLSAVSAAACCYNTCLMKPKMSDMKDSTGWNFTNAGEELVTWNRESSINASRVVSPFADGENIPASKPRHQPVWKKREIPERFYTDDRDRYLTFQRAFVDICSISALSSPSPELPEIS